MKASRGREIPLKLSEIVVAVVLKLLFRGGGKSEVVNYILCAERGTRFICASVQAYIEDIFIIYIKKRIESIKSTQNSTHHSNIDIKGSVSFETIN